MQDDLEHISFAEWLVELNACAVKAGYKTDQTFTQITGQLEWYHFYVNGHAPRTAIAVATKDGAEYSIDYCF